MTSIMNVSSGANEPKVGQLLTSMVINPTLPTSSEQKLAIAIVIVMPALAFVIICTRIAGRLSSHQFGWDDGLVSIAMGLSILETFISVEFIRTNFVGIHEADIPPHDPVPTLQWNYAVQILYNPILALVKTSILIFLLRLFGQKPGVRRFIYWLNVANIAQMTAVFFAIIFQCIPIEKNWIPDAEGSCIDRRILFTTSSAWNIFTDLLVLGLPLRIFIDLKIPRRTKIALMFVFLLGFLVTIVGIIRLSLLVQGLFMLVRSNDPSFDIGFVTSAIETNLVLITASAPALRPLLRAWFPRMFGVRPGEKIEGAMERRVMGVQTRPNTANNNATTTTTRMTRIKSSRTELRSHSPGPGEEEEYHMTPNGIVRRSDVFIQWDPRSGDLMLANADEEDKRMGRWF